MKVNTNAPTWNTLVFSLVILGIALFGALLIPDLKSYQLQIMLVAYVILLIGTLFRGV